MGEEKERKIIEENSAKLVVLRNEETVKIAAVSDIQLVMEKLGGGGHRNVAGAQLEGVSMDEALTTVRELITNMLEKGELSK